QERATECFLRVINLDPSRTNAFRHLGNSYQEAGNLEASLKMFQRAWTLDPNSRETCLSLCLAYRDAGSITDAVEHLSLLVQRHPDWDRAHQERGKVFYQSGRVMDALEDFKAAHALSPLDPENLFNLASLFQEIKGDDEAKELYEALLLVVPGHSRAKQNLACILYGSGQLAEAEKLLQEVVAAEKSWVPPLFLLGLVQEGKGCTSEAMASYQQAILLAPEDTGIMLQLAGVLLKSFRSQAAIVVLERAAAIDDENRPMVLYQLAQAYRTAGDFERAGALARSCQECARDPELAKAAKTLETQSLSSRKKTLFRKGR
ncbi:MAG TPA: tetratricopeptide repeat protein, partial [Chroococcales cyanobacterium]